MAGTQTQNITIRAASLKDLNSLKDLSLQLRQSKDPDYFEQQFDYQKQNKRLLLMAESTGQDVAYCILNWQPKYGYFRAHNMPEIQDLNVLPAFRKRGIATGLIRHCESLAAEKGYKQMGISFGLDASYGPAQKLYIKLGYQPDGLGITYDRKTVSFGEFKPVDDQLCLMLFKNL